MASYDILDRWKFEESTDDDDESRKEVQIVQNTDHDDGIYIRAAYYGPSGRYGQDAPTFDISKENQQDLIDALQEAFPRARKLRREAKIEETFEESDFSADELQQLAELAKQAGGVEELKDQIQE